MHQLHFIAWGLSLGMVACAPRPSLSAPDQRGEIRLSIGEGGGFSGRERTWVLSPQGRVALIEQVGALGREVGRIQERKASELCREAEARVHGNVALTPIGNTYRFIAFSDGVREARLTWTDPLPSMDPALERIIRELEKIRK